jgi:hypothetical protein
VVRAERIELVNPAGTVGAVLRPGLVYLSNDDGHLRIYLDATSPGGGVVGVTDRVHRRLSAISQGGFRVEGLDHGSWRIPIGIGLKPNGEEGVWVPDGASEIAPQAP